MENIHDKFVKASFSDPGRAIAFFEKFLPDHVSDTLDLHTLTCLQESYLTDDLKAGFSDLVFEVKEKGTPHQATDIVLLFEHKSSPDKHVLIQVGMYIFSHWLRCIRQKKPLKPIIPIIYYQGKKIWKVRPVKRLFDKSSPNIIRFIPDLPHLFIALQSLSDEAIANMRNNMMSAAIMAQKNTFDPIELAEDLKKIFKLFPLKADEGNFLKTIFVYLFNVSEVPKNEWVKAIEIIPTDIKENLMTTYTWMKEEGRQEGIKEVKTKVILKGFEEGLNIKILANITNLTEQQVLQILNENHINKK